MKFPTTLVAMTTYVAALTVTYVGGLHKEFIAVTFVIALIVAVWRIPDKPTAAAAPRQPSAPKKRGFWASKIGSNRDVTRRIPVTLTNAEWMAFKMVAVNDDEQIGKLCSATLSKQAKAIIQQSSVALKGNAAGGKPGNDKKIPGPSNGQGQPPQQGGRYEILDM